MLGSVNNGAERVDLYAKFGQRVGQRGLLAQTIDGLNQCMSQDFVAIASVAKAACARGSGITRDGCARK